MVEGLQGGLEAGALVADDAVGGDSAVLEVEFGGRRSLDAELLLQRADGEAGVVLVHHERRDAVGLLLRIGDGHDGVPARLAAVGDPAFGAVEHPVVAVASGAGLHPGGIRAGLTLGEGVGGHRLTGGDRREHLLLEFVGAVENEAHRAELVDGGDQRRRRAHPRDLLDDDAGGHRVSTLSVVLLGHVDRVEARRHQRVERLLREAGVLVDVSGVRLDLLLGKRADRLAERDVLLGEFKNVEIGVSETHDCGSSRHWVPNGG